MLKKQAFCPLDLQLKYIRAVREETIFELNKIVQEVKFPFRVYLPIAGMF